MNNNQHIQVIKSDAPNASDAVLDLSRQNKISHISGIILFCSSHYDLDTLSFELKNAFTCEIIGCTTAGEITDNFYDESIIALVISSDCFQIQSALIDDVQNFNLSHAMSIASTFENKLEFSQHFTKDKMFGLLLTDGLSLKEENITSLLFQALGGINIIGGSAGDNMDFKETFVFYNGKFHKNSSIIILFETLADFDVFKIQHFIPTEKELIITDVDFEKHIVKEIDGEPATQAYARINGLDVDKLNSLDFAMHPLMLKIADEWYIRSISNVAENNSLQFRCAIDTGLPLRVGKGIDIVKKLEEEVLQIEYDFEEIYFTLGCDCISRRIEIFQKGHEDAIASLFERINFFGFNSYGEQYNGIHFNQTLVAIVAGVKRSG